VGKTIGTKTFIGLKAIFLGNTYKNYLTIDLVFPRAEHPIQNVTNLLDLKFKIIQMTSLVNIRQDKSRWLRNTNIILEIDESKRAKYVREVHQWLKFTPRSVEMMIRKLVSMTEKNAWLDGAPYHIQVLHLNRINEITLQSRVILSTGLLHHNSKISIL
jgi:hypothetical protein